MMSSPLPISYLEPGTSTTHSASGGILGSSPRTQQAPATSARKFYKRLLYDATVDASQFTVGLLETREQAERKSGVEAWSLRLHSSLNELGFSDFVARFEGEDIPFHRIAFFKQNGVVVWEAENLVRKAGEHHNHCNGHGNNSMQPHSSSRSDLPPVPALSNSFTGGCSPTAGSFMARLAAAGTAGAAGLPPRASYNQLPDYSSGSSSFTAANSSGKPQRLSATDYGSSPQSWGGPGHWSATAAGASGVAGGASQLGTSPIGSAALYGTSPKLVGSWTGSGTPPGILAAVSRGNSYTISPSPGGSCSSSWAGTSPLAAALAAGATSLPHPGASSAAGSSAGGVPAAPTSPQGAVSLAGAGDTVAAVGELQLQEQFLLLQQLEGQEQVLADYSQLPEECWVLILQQLTVKELCIMSRINRALKGLTARSFLWSTAYERLFGTAPPAEWSAQTVKRLCRRSELRASRWLEADVEGRSCGFSGTWCCQLDDTKVVSGDGCAVRLWSHDTGRRIATLRGHTGRVTSVAFDDEYIISGCSQGTVKLWSMDELKLSKTLRHHTGPVSSTVLLHGLPISGSKDGSVCVWDAAAPNTPLVVLEINSPVQALELQEDKGHLLCASSNLGVYDMTTTQLLYNLQAPPAGLGRISSSSSSGSSAAGPAGTIGLAETAEHAAVIAPDSSADPAAPAADVFDEGDDADALDGVLLQDGWLEDDSSSSVGDDDVAVPEQVSPNSSKPFTSLSCYGNLVAAGRAGSVVLWDLRSQDAVGMVSASAAGPGRASRPASAPCIGVQLDDWKLVTGWAASESSGGGESSCCWWRSSTDVTGAAGAWEAATHSLEVYDIRAAASFSSCDASSSSSKGLWTASAVMSLPVPNRVTCFQFHKENLLVGQEGADCCLISFNPPGSSNANAAAAWGYAGSSRAAAAAGQGCYGASPNGNRIEQSGDVGDGGKGGKGKKKGAAKVPAKKQTRYPKRATR